MIHADGREWCTANEVPEMWPDVTANAVRLWARNGKVNPVRAGGKTYYDLNELTEAEYASRTSTRGNKRGVALTSGDAVP